MCYSRVEAFLVINPSVRLSWISNNWEDKWKNIAIDKIKSLVSTFNHYLYDGRQVNLMQMKTYHSDEKKTPEDLAKAVPPVNPWLFYVDDLESDEEGDISTSEQTIEEEYMAYVTSLPRRSTVDPVKFWEVNGTILPQFTFLSF